MANEKEVVDTVTLGMRTINFVADYIDEEFQILYSLASAVASQLNCDPKNPGDNDNICAFRLTELLEERLGTTKFRENILDILIGRV